MSSNAGCSSDNDYIGGGFKVPQQGVTYQLEVIRLFHLRLSEQKLIKKNYLFGTEFEEAAKFDDIIIRYQRETDPLSKLRLFQLKHHHMNVKNITREQLIPNRKSKDDSYDLNKYFHSFLSIRKRCKDSRSKFYQCEIEDLCLLTNTGVESELIDSMLVEQTNDNDFLLFNNNLTADYQNNFKIYKIKSMNNESFIRSSDFTKLIRILANFTRNDEKVVLKTHEREFLQSYYFPLMRSVFIRCDDKWIQFRDEFLTEESDKEVVNFREALADQLDFRLDPIILSPLIRDDKMVIDDINTFVQQLVNLVKRSQDFRVRIDQIGDNQFIKNLTNVSRFLFVEHYTKIRFNTWFMNCNHDGLSSNLREFQECFINGLKQADIDIDSLFDYEIIASALKTFPHSHYEECLPSRAGELDVIDFFDKFKLVVNFSNSIETSRIFEHELSEKFRTKNCNALSLQYRDKLYKWMCDPASYFHDSQSITKFLDDILNNQLLWSLNELTAIYFSDQIKRRLEIKFKRFELLETFLQSPDDQILFLDGINYRYLRFKLVRSFQELIEHDWERYRRYTRQFGHIFLNIDDKSLENFSKRLSSNQQDKEQIISTLSSFDLIVFDCNDDGNQGMFNEIYTILHHHIRECTGKKVICISGSRVDLLPKFNQVKPIRIDHTEIIKPLHEITDDSCQQLLKTTVTFQDQSIPLESLLVGEEIMALLVDTDTTMRLLNSDEPMKLGHVRLEDIGYDPSIYIDRKFYQYSCLDIFSKTEPTEVFVISGMDPDNIPENFSLVSSIYIITRTDDDVEDMKFRLKDYSGATNYHFIRHISGRFHWYETMGNFSNIHKLFRPIKSTPITEEALLNSSSKVVIVTDIAGMGKSTVLTSLCKIITQTFPEIWCLRINLNDHWAEFNKAETSSDAAVFLVDKLWAPNRPVSKFERKLLIYSIRYLKNVIIFLDGFDEISPRYEGIVKDICIRLSQLNVRKLIVTSRPNMMIFLEKSLRTVSYFLCPFDSSDQVLCLGNYWDKTWTNDKNYISEYAKQVIVHVSNSVRDNRLENTGIPLHINMLAKLITSRSDAEEFLRSTNSTVLTLYENSVKGKLNIFMEEKLCASTLAAIEGAQSLEESFYVNHRLTSISVFFPDLRSVLKDYQIEDLKKFYESIESCKERYGFITAVNNGTPCFIHRTFAEYFIMEYIFDVLSMTKGYMSKRNLLLLSLIFTKSQFNVVRSFLNLKLSRNTLTDEHLKFWNVNFKNKFSELILSKMFVVNMKEANSNTIQFFLRSITTSPIGFHRKGDLLLDKTRVLNKISLNILPILASCIDRDMPDLLEYLFKSLPKDIITLVDKEELLARVDSKKCSSSIKQLVSNEIGCDNNRNLKALDEK